MYIFSLIKWNYQVANSEAQIYCIPYEKGSRNPDDNLRNHDVQADWTNKSFNTVRKTPWFLSLLQTWTFFQTFLFSLCDWFEVTCPAILKLFCPMTLPPSTRAPASRGLYWTPSLDSCFIKEAGSLLSSSPLPSTSPDSSTSWKMSVSTTDNFHYHTMAFKSRQNNWNQRQHKYLEDGHQKVVGAKELFDGVVEQAEVRWILVPLHLDDGRFRAKLAKTKIVSTSSICRSNFVVNILSRSKAALRSFTYTIGKDESERASWHEKMDNKTI